MENRDEFIISKPEEVISDVNYASVSNETNKVIPIIEERVTIDKKLIEKATVRVSKSVHETTQQIAVPLMEEEVVVTHVNKNEYVDTPPPAIRYEGDVMIISVLQEVPVVTKRLMLVEELHITKKQHQKSEMVEVMLRKEEVNVSRTENNSQDLHP